MVIPRPSAALETVNAIRRTRDAFVKGDTHASVPSQHDIDDEVVGGDTLVTDERGSASVGRVRSVNCFSLRDSRVLRNAKQLLLSSGRT